MNKIEQHIAQQIQIFNEWKSASPLIKREFVNQRQRLAQLEKLTKTQASQIAELQSRLRSLETAPRGLRALLK